MDANSANVAKIKLNAAFKVRGEMMWGACVNTELISRACICRNVNK